eukprot:1161977-Pelagomonas_calceolata.AAC.1
MPMNLDAVQPMRLRHQIISRRGPELQAPKEQQTGIQGAADRRPRSSRQASKEQQTGIQGAADGHLRRRAAWA